MVRRGIDEKEGITRRSFLKGAVGAGTAGFLGVATYGTVRSLFSPERKLQGDVLDTFVYANPQGAALPIWYREEGLVNTEARLSQFEVGKGANVVWKAIRDSRGNIIPTGLPGLLIRMDEDTLDFPQGYPRDDFVKGGLFAVFNCCTHACCRPSWKLLSRSAYLEDPGYDNVYCPCHDSQYNPRRLFKYRHPAPPTASGAEYLGIYKEPGLGPADRGMPLIPLELEGDKIVGTVKNVGWYQYLDFKKTVISEE